MPGVRVGFQVDAQRLTAQIGAYARASQDARPKATIVREQMKFFFRALIDLTPFETFAQGREVVHRDLLRAVKPYGGEDGKFSKVKNEGLRSRLVDYLRRRDYDKIRDIFTHLNARGGYYSGYVMEDFNPSLHHRYQSRKGRVESDHRVLTPQVQEWRSYLALLQREVGRARGGWTSSAESVGLRLPNWVTRHAAGGSAAAELEPNRVRFVFTNRAIFIPDYRRAVELALKGREKAMANDLRRMYQGVATHAGFGR